MHEHLSKVRQHIRRVEEDLQYVRWQASTLLTAAKIAETSLARCRISIDNIEEWYRNEGNKKVEGNFPDMYLLRDGLVYPTPPQDAEKQATRLAGGCRDAFDEESYGPLLEASCGIRGAIGGRPRKIEIEGEVAGSP